MARGRIAKQLTDFGKDLDELLARVPNLSLTNYSKETTRDSKYISQLRTIDSRHPKKVIKDLLKPFAKRGVLSLEEAKGFALMHRRRVLSFYECKELFPNETDYVIDKTEPNWTPKRIGQSTKTEPDGDVLTQPFNEAPSPPPNFTGRKKQLKEIKDKLRNKETHPIVIWGIPGQGKTSVAEKLAYDEELIKKFADGVLWANLGQDCEEYEIESILKLWCRDLKISVINLDSKPISERMQQISEHIRYEIGDRSVLLVVDDIWEVGDSKYFINACGRNCKILFTTRSLALARSISSEAYNLEDLVEKDGIELLKHYAPTVVSAEPDEAKDLVREVRSLPLALVILGKYLDNQSLGDFKKIIHEAITKLKEAKERMYITDDTALPSHRSLFAAIEISYKILSSQTQDTLRALSYFRPKPDDFSEDAALAISEQRTEQLQDLIRAGLIETLPKRKLINHNMFTMHAIIADYGREVSPKEAVEYYHRGTEFYTRCLRNYEESPEEVHATYYERQYSYEKPEWQHDMIQWLYFQAYTPERGSANLNFASLYFGAFWWWGCYCQFPFCDKLLEMWGTQRSDVDQKWLAALLQFHKSYPHHHSYPIRYIKEDTDKWRLVKKALEHIRKLGGLEREKSELDKISRHVRGLTNMFLGESYHYVDKNYKEAESLFKEAKKLFEEAETDDDNWSIPWTLWYLADLYLEREESGDFEKALQYCQESIKIANEANKMEPDKRDNEIIANDYRVMADVYWRQNKYELAFKNYTYAVYFAYLYQRYPHPPDFYTVEFYKEMRTRTRNRFDNLWSKNKQQEIIQAYRNLRNFWGPYWGLVDKPSPDLPPTNPTILINYVLPPPPTNQEMGNQATEYVNRVEEVSKKIKLG